MGRPPPMKLRRRRSLVLALLAVHLVAMPSPAQQGVLPADERPELPDFPASPPAQAPLQLPELPEPSPEERRQLSSGLRVHVERFEVTGSTVFEPEELAAVTAPHAGQAIGTQELTAAADAVTTLYIEHGYVTSGAVVPDQDVSDGVVRIQVIEGSITQIDVRGARWFRPYYFQSRLRPVGGAPVNVFRLEQQLQRFQRDPYIERVEARLQHGESLGSSHLVLVVEEKLPLRLNLVASNQRSPSIGSIGLDVQPRIANLLGLGDELRADIGLTEGLNDYDVRYAVPVTPWDTRIGGRFRYTRGEVVEEPFDELDIVSFLRTIGVTVEQPLFRSEAHDLRVGLIGEHRKGETELLGENFCTIPQAVDCDSVVSVLRVFQAWTWRTRRSVLAARSTLNFGLDILGATRNPGSVPDGEFFAWLGQVQWAMRLPETLLETEIVARLDTQLSADPLLPIEKFALGGARTVRGYRENGLVRDNGVVASVELRIPLWREPLGRRVLELAPFADFGHAWDRSSPAKLPTRTIASLGVGLRFSPWKWLYGELYWGGRLRSLSTAGSESDLQDDGISFLVRVDQDLLTGWLGD